MKAISFTLVAAAIAGVLSGCQPAPESTENQTTQPMLTVEDAQNFVDSAQREMTKMSVPAAKAAWVYATNINDDTATVNAYLSELYSNRAAELAKQAADFNHV